jgi:hypothetical protein
MSACRDCGNEIERRTDPVGYGRTWAETDAFGDARDFQCGLSADSRHHPERRGCFDVQGNYGQGWETVTAETTWREANARRQEYRDNELGVPFRIKWVPPPRLRYGDQDVCVCCGMNVEWCGKPAPRVLIPAADGRPAVTMTAGGWVGRGGDRFCDESGAVGTFPHRLHRVER